MSTLSNILRENRFRPEDVPRFENKLFFEGARRRPYLERFFVLLLLAATIATAGVLGDSTATVIGAMIVAPLMTPIMATAAALVMGNMYRATHSLMLVVIGIFSVLVLGMVFGWLYTGIISFEENTQIVARISPRLIDLVAALASGAAGAFCLSREDVADSLPGVAISISLVPPLCVVGVSISAGEWAAANGAMLLFITNFLSILLAGGGVLALLNLNKAAMVEIKGVARRNAFLMIIFAVLLIMVPLAATSRRITQDTLTEMRSQAVADEWVQGSDYKVRQVHVAGDTVTVTITGDEIAPPFVELVTAVRQALGSPVVVHLEIVPVEELSTLEDMP